MATVLALDVGSSSVRAQRFDEQAEPVDERRQARYDGGDVSAHQEIEQLIGEQMCCAFPVAGQRNHLVVTQNEPKDIRLFELAMTHKSVGTGEDSR